MTRVEFSKKITYLLNRIEKDGVDYVLDYVVRSRVSQQWLYAKGRKQLDDGSWIVVDQNKVVTKCDGIKNMSKHQAGLAIDIYFVINGQIDFRFASQESRSLSIKYHNFWVGSGGKPIIEWDRAHYEG